MKYFLSLAACAALPALVYAAKPAFTPTTVDGHFVEQFTSDLSDSRWSPSKATKDEVLGEVFSYVGEWAVEEPTVFPGLEGDKALVIKSRAAHHAISVPFETPYSPNGKTTVISYEVKLQKGLDCGGAYIKLLTDAPTNAEEFSDKTPYTIMFGPDRCGPTSKVHFIVRHKNQLTGEIEEKHLMSPPTPKITKTTALYTLVIRPDNEYEILVNNESQKKGSLLDDFSPAFAPAKEIDDPDDFKPADWVDQPKITDPDAVKPADWDEDAPETILDLSEERPAGWLSNEPLQIADPEAEKPEEWDDEDDGDYQAPLIPNPACAAAPGCGPWTPPSIPNPAYKGKWFAPLIDNPEYKGVWAPAKIDNPAYYDIGDELFSQIAGIGIELWSMTEDIAFDNIFIGSSESDAQRFIHETFLAKKPIEDKEEETAKPAEEPLKPNIGPKPKFAVDPVGFAAAHALEFVEAAKLNPFEAVKSYPETAGALAAAFAVSFALLSALLSLLAGGKKKAPVVAKKAKAVAAKKTDAITTDDVDKADVSDAPLAEKKAEDTPSARTRSAKTKAQ